MVVNVKLDRGKMVIQPDSGKVVFRYSDIESLPEWPEGPLIELIQGDIFMVPSPNLRHQQIVMKLGRAISEFLGNQPIGTVFNVPVDVILSENDVVIPDVLVVLDQQKQVLRKENIQGTPDFIAEVLSTNTRLDKEIKKDLYEKHGVKEYWIVDPEHETIEIFLLGTDGKFKQGAVHSSKEKAVTSTILHGLTIFPRDLFN